MTTVGINQASELKELSTAETLSISGGSWLSSSVHFAVGKAVAEQTMWNVLPDFYGHFGFEIYRSVARQ